MARMVAWGLLGLCLAVAAQLAFMYINSMQYDKRPEMRETFACPSLDESAALGRFRRLLTFPSVSNHSMPDHMNDPQVFRDMLASLEESYPLVWQRLVVEEVGVNGFSRLITWAGSQPELLPALFVSHYDVVPVTPGTEASWTQPPFSGALEDGYVWGRGAADIKFSVAALLEAASSLLQGGFRPTRTIMFAFGHDEEVSGGLGAAATAQLLRSRGVELDVVVDEGGLVLLDGMKPFTTGPVALVGLAEKGASSVEVTLRSAGGHSSMPLIDGSDVQSQMWRLTSAMKLLPPPSVLQPPVTDMLREMVPYAPAWMRPLMASCGREQSWLVNRLLAFMFRRLISRDTAALVTNTIALTRLKAGVANNVLPQEAVLGFNARVLPGSAPQDVVSHLERAARLAGVAAEVRLMVKDGAWPGSNVTRSSGRHYQLLRQAIRETWREDGQPDVAVVPFLLMGGTDSKHYAALSRGGILRFVPYGMNKTAGDLGLIHSTNERIRAPHFARAVCSYVRVLQLFSGPEQEAEAQAEAK